MTCRELVAHETETGFIRMRDDSADIADGMRENLGAIAAS
jgi:hypothetical protein